jgi:hypothetical protein
MATAGFLVASAPAWALTTAATNPAIAVSDHAATLKGLVTPDSSATAYYFDWGTTTAYGTQTTVTYVSTPAIAQVVKAKLTGLAPGTLYHYRLVAGQGVQVSFGLDLTFKTSAGDADEAEPTGDQGGSGETSGGLPTPGGDPLGDLTSPVPGTASKPVEGESVGVSRGSGSVRVKVPGASRFAVLTAGAPVPVGSTIDARRGTAKLVTAVGSNGDTQSASFRGGIFQVRQSGASRGMTDIYLRGGGFSACRRAGRHARVAVSAARKRRRHRTVRHLWGRDHHGRFRTHGRNAIATVRGTEWTVADRCDGTLTKVRRGAVSVRDRRRHKTVLVKAGHRYLAARRR